MCAFCRMRESHYLSWLTLSSSMPAVHSECPTFAPYCWCHLTARSVTRYPNPVPPMHCMFVPVHSPCTLTGSGVFRDLSCHVVSPHPGFSRRLRAIHPARAPSPVKIPSLVCTGEIIYLFRRHECRSAFHAFRLSVLSVYLPLPALIIIPIHPSPSPICHTRN